MTMVTSILPPDVEEAAISILKVLDVMRETYPDMSLTLAFVLIAVEAFPGITKSGVLEKTGMNAPAVELACRVLGSDRPEGQGSLHLIERHPSPTADAQDGFVVTPKGAELLQRVSAAVAAAKGSSGAVGGRSGAGAR